MQRLYSICTARRKVLKTFPKGTHNDSIASPGYFEALTEFLEDLSLLPGSTSKI